MLIYCLKQAYAIYSHLHPASLDDASVFLQSGQRIAKEEASLRPSANSARQLGTPARCDIFQWGMLVETSENLQSADINAIWGWKSKLASAWSFQSGELARRNTGFCKWTENPFHLPFPPQTDLGLIAVFTSIQHLYLLRFNTIVSPSLVISVPYLFRICSVFVPYLFRI